MYKIDYFNSDGYCGLEYKSPKEQESELNSKDDFERYFYSLYRCTPSEQNDFNARRNQMRNKYPKLVIPFGAYFILTGQAAYEIMSTYYYTLSLVAEFSEKEKNYYFDRFNSVKQMHEKSQSLPFPIDMTEGQLGTDENIEFYIKEAIINKLLSVWQTK